MAPIEESYHVDWICSNTSNVHVANNKDWFTKLTEFKSQLGSIYLGPKVGPEILGVGDVELEVVKSVSPGGKKLFRKIFLRNVVYAPTNNTNIFACSPSTGFGLDFMHGKFFLHTTHQAVGMIDVVVLTKLWLKGQPRGKSCLDPNMGYCIGATWPLEEEYRWKAHQQELVFGLKPRYNEEEKLWLKKNFGNEFRFLQQYGLSIYKEEDRDDGKRIVKALMAGEDEGKEEEEHENSSLADSEADRHSHVADYDCNEAETFCLVGTAL